MPALDCSRFASPGEQVGKPLKICLMGASLDSGNMGVSALATSLVQLVRKIRPDASVSLFIGNHSSRPQEIDTGRGKIPIEILNYRQHPASQPGASVFCLLFLALLYRFISFKPARRFLLGSNSRLRRLAESDFLGDIRGGDSFSDIYGLRNFLLGSIPSFLALLLQKRLLLLPQTYGPYKSPLAQRVAAFLMDRSACILTRDRSGIEQVQNLLRSFSLANKLVQFCPDVAFSLEPFPPEDLEIVPPLKKTGSAPIIGLNLSGLLYNGGYTRNNMFGLKFDYREFVDCLAGHLLRTTNAHLLLVPHTFAPAGHVECDPDACSRVQRSFAAAYPQRLHVVSREYDAMRLKSIIGLCDFFIGSRMHACIAALSQGIPTVGVAYSKKFLGVFESIGVGDLVIDARTAEAREAIETIGRHFQQRQALRSRIVTAVSEARSLLLHTFERLLASV